MSDPVGPSELRLIVLDTQDSVWTGRPGDDTLVRVRAFNTYGEPVANARVMWEASGTGSGVPSAAVVTDQRGFALARWRIGTDAAERQQLRLTARQAGSLAAVVIQGRVVPHVVAALRIAVDTPLAFRLGDTLTLPVLAVDPYSNTFPAPDLVLSSDDSSIVRVHGATLTSAARRGTTTVTFASSGQEFRAAVRVVQVVAGIEPAIDTLRFSSLGAELPVRVAVRDDRGYLVPDTTVMIAVADTTVAQAMGGVVRSVGSGATALRLSLGSVETTIAVAVRQRVASLRLVRDTLRLDALQDTTTVHLIARDSLGAIIRNPLVVYTVSDSNVAKIGPDRTLEALTPGAAVLTALDTLTGISVSAEVVVAQRIAKIDVAPLLFDALGDSVPLAVVARDRLGSPVVGAALEYAISDTTVAAVAADGHVRSVGAGQTLVSARDPESGAVGTAELAVDPVATELTVAVTLEDAVLTLPVGASLPLACLARDRNGFAIAQPVAFVGSVRGTVSGPGCGNMQVQRSGYDTLRFALGQAQVSVPVIIATRPDSVGVLAAAQPLTADANIRFVGEDLAKPSYLALRPLVTEILAAYGNPTSNLGRARAIRDWVARTALYSQSVIHPSNSTSNLSVLPPGKTWADVNVLLSQEEWDRDVAFWADIAGDGYAVLNRLLGTLDPVTGLRADDGMMVHVTGAHYRMRDIESYRFFLCSYQTVVMNTLWAAAGLHGTLLWTFAHDPAAVFIPELGRWVYQDASYNNDYLLDGTGDPLSPVDLLGLSTNGTGDRAGTSRISGPVYDPEVYIQNFTYMTAIPNGMVFMGALVSRWDLSTPWTGRLVQIDVPALANYSPANDQTLFPRVTPGEAFPVLGVVVADVQMEDSVFVAHLASNYPNHQRFERRVQGGEWEPAAANDVLPIGACVVEYRSIDNVGTSSATAVLSVWAPRAPEFLTAGSPVGIRSQARSCP